MSVRALFDVMLTRSTKGDDSQIVVLIPYFSKSKLVMFSLYYFHSAGRNHLYFLFMLIFFFSSHRLYVTIQIVFLGRDQLLSKDAVSPVLASIPPLY